MLTRLSISNYALIDTLELHPDSRLSIITGETGAGKSIMLDALGLLLGERSDAAAVTDKDRKSVVEAVFSSLTPEAESALQLVDPDWEGGDLIVRREISPNGRSRAFINDSPVRLSELAEVTSSLVDIHSQHSNAALLRSSSQLALIDCFSDSIPLLEEYRKEFSRYLSLRNEIRKEREALERSRSNRALFEYQLGVLDKLKPQRGELEQVERRFDILSDAEEIREHLYAAFQQLDGEGAALGCVSEALEEVNRVDMDLFEDSNPDVDDEEATSTSDFSVIDRLRQVYIELKDIAETIGGFASSVDSDPGELSRVTSRMNSLYEAVKEFRVATADDLVDLRDELSSKLAALNGTGGDLPRLEKDARKSAALLKEKAARLSEVRNAGAVRFAEAVAEAAMPLGMPNLHFVVELKSGKLTRDGADCVAFMTSFNKNMPLQELAKVASGGEMARLMLCVKAVMARKMNLPTLIFDEIDTGVSGEIAEKMGRMMRDISDRTQVLAITHLPQVASIGNTHFKVFKHDNEERTVSEVRSLSEKERVDEIAAMLSGETVTSAAFEAARGLLQSNNPKNDNR